MKFSKSFNCIIKVVLLLVVIITGCKKDDVAPAPLISLSVITDTVELFVKDSVTITAAVQNNVAVEHSWKIADSVCSRVASYTYKATNERISTLTYTGGNAQGSYTRKIILKTIARVRPITATSSKYISQVLGYLPAPGQFVNETIADINAPNKIIGGTGSLLHLGAYGGYVIFTFDHSIINKTGMDLAIYANPLPPALEWSEPGIVMVSQDKNGNGLADDPWYELAGSEYNQPETRKKYKITYYNPKAYANVPWKDNLGNTGAVEINNFHKHNYYPLFAANQDSISFEGTLLKSTFGMVGSIYVNKGFNLGYVDNYSAGDNYAVNKYNSFDLSWAVDENGNPVVLPAIDFVKVYTGQNNKGNTLLGEISTEIRGAVDLNTN